MFSCFQQKNSITKDDELIVVSQKTRHQYENLDHCLDKVKEMIKEAAFEPDPPSQEIIARIERIKHAANEKRLEDKKKKQKHKKDRKIDWNKH